ncbi:MAG: alternative ribosome rescue aminoacyl-tRNA hydrolase ArfB [Dehalococcoidales bacterium]|jgi:ribosome-associated protein|nr:alternative ribosome rescue aminoacyl-tRNA hydrolase ArfB [Dehalococcoidales bacterium]
MIRITRTITIDESEIQEYFVGASGPGGQNVNKVATAVQLRFDVANSRSLPEEVRTRLSSLAGNRITEDGILIIGARRFRTQGRKREDATDRLVELIRAAAQRPRIRRKTRPTLASKMRRLESKRRGAESKRLRGPVHPGNE